MIQRASCRSLVILALLVANMVQGFIPDPSDLVSFRGLYLVLGALNESAPSSDECADPGEVCGTSCVVETAHLCWPTKGRLAAMVASTGLWNVAFESASFLRTSRVDVLTSADLIGSRCRLNC
jgi:hypothetical protein